MKILLIFFISQYSEILNECLRTKLQIDPPFQHYDKLDVLQTLNSWAFGGSAGKESTCNVGDLGSIPGLEKSPGEGNGYPLQCSGLENSMDYVLVSLIAQLAKNIPAMQQTLVRFLGEEGLLEKGQATHSSSILGLPLWLSQ